MTDRWGCFLVSRHHILWGFQKFSRRDKLLAKRRPFMKYEICSKDGLFIKVLQTCGLFFGMVLVFSIFQSHKCHKLPQHLSSAIQPPAPQATHGKRHLCADVGDLILVKAQHLQGPVAAQSLCKRLRKRNLGNSSANISACVCVSNDQTKPIVNIPVKQNREIPSDTLCYLRTIRPVILLLPLLQDK